MYLGVTSGQVGDYNFFSIQKRGDPLGAGRDFFTVCAGSSTREVEMKHAGLGNYPKTTSVCSLRQVAAYGE